MLPKPWLWNSGTRQFPWRMFLAMIAWAGATDQLTTAWMPGVAFILATRALRSVALLS